MKKNSEATRFYSDKQEKSVCKDLGGVQQSNSGAGLYRKGDVIIPDMMLVECKCSMSPKSSFSIKKEWIQKNKEEAFSQRLLNSCIAFNFGPDEENYYVIDRKLMQFLVEKLSQNI